MDRLTRIRSEEKKYHDYCYDTYDLFEPDSWLHKPVTTVINLINQYKDHEYISILDLGAGVGRNSIPIAESFKSGNGKVVCVDLLESAIEKLIVKPLAFEINRDGDPVMLTSDCITFVAKKS